MADETRPLRIIPLGGVGEIGKNMYLFEYGDDIVVIDCGLMFPDEEMFGIDLVIPDISYLKEHRANVRAFLITHAHEDHVGGLPYVLPEFPGVPVYASTLARGLLGNKIKEHKLHNNPMLALEPGDEIDDRPVHGHPVPDRPLDPGRDGHRPADPGRHDRPHRRLQVRPHPGRRQAVRLRDPGQARRGGRRLPPVGLDPGREPRLHAVRADGRRGLPRDHGAARRPGHRGHLRQQHRPGPAGPRRGRDLRPQGRPSSAARWSRTSGSPATSATSSTRPRQIVAKDKIGEIPADKLVICTTGAQGEPMAGLARMANRDHRFVEIVPGDTVIVSASPIPGNEEYVSRTIDNLFKAGANVFYHTIKRAHVSGHASQEELKLMLGLTKPRHFIPMHGEFRMQVQHGRLAIETGVLPENVFIIENGTPIEILPDGSARRGQPVDRRLRVRGRPVRRRGRRGRPARPARARQRRHVHDRRHRRQADRARSSAGPRSSPAASCPTRTTRSSNRPPNGSSRPSRTRATTSARSRSSRCQIKDAVSRHLYERTKRRPMVFPVVVEV